MGDGFFDRREWVSCGHWYLHTTRRDHLGRLRHGWRSFGRGLRMAQPKAFHGNWLEDNVERADRHWSPAHRRKADERAVLRERRCEHARRGPADTVEREADLSLTDCRFDLLRYIARIDDDDVRAKRLKLGHELFPSHNVDGLQASGFRERDHPSPDTRIGGVLHHPLARFQIDILTKQECRRRRIDREHRQLLRVRVGRQREEAVCGCDQSLPPGEAGKRRQDAVADLHVFYALPHRENAANTFVADYARKRGADCIDSVCEQEVAWV